MKEAEFYLVKTALIALIGTQKMKKRLTENLLRLVRSVVAKFKSIKTIAHNGWGLTKFKKYQMKKIEKTFFKFCLSPCYLSVHFSFLCGGEKNNFKIYYSNAF
jgi:hypothetical protein